MALEWPRVSCTIFWADCFLLLRGLSWLRAQR